MSWRTDAKLRVLGYHGIDDPERFAAQLDYLRRSYRPVTLSEVNSALEGATELPRKSVLVTFDDGDPTIIEHLSLLVDRGIPAVAFIIAGLVDGVEAPWWRLVEVANPPEAPSIIRDLKRIPDRERRQRLRTMGDTNPATPQLTSSDLRRLGSAGVAIGNHTLTHPCLPRCDDETIAEEVVKAHRTLTEVMGAAPESFAYPNGDWDVRAERHLRELGYRSAFLFDHRVSAATHGNPLRVSRLRVNSSTSIERFSLIMSGVHPALHRLRGGK